jgi:hypothetical protein
MSTPAGEDNLYVYDMYYMLASPPAWSHRVNEPGVRDSNQTPGSRQDGEGRIRSQHRCDAMGDERAGCAQQHSDDDGRETAVIGQTQGCAGEGVCWGTPSTMRRTRLGGRALHDAREVGASCTFLAVLSVALTHSVCLSENT